MNKESILYFKLKSWYIKTTNWEYWPIWIVYGPVFVYYIYLAIKARSFFFFSTTNPGIETGGMFFESKWKIYQLIPKQYYPKTFLVEPNRTFHSIVDEINNNNIYYPIICKPDRGNRGWKVRKLNNESELLTYFEEVQVPFLIQEYIDHKVELGLFYFRNPGEEKGNIPSLTGKKLLSITGNGKSTIAELMLKNNRAFLQYYRLKAENKINFDEVLANNEKKILVPYGNHVLGAEFQNLNHVIDQELVNTFDTICKSIPGFYFGRFDLRVTSIEDLKKGKNISILELNGAGGEPAHIYDPNFKFVEAQRVLINHHRMMFQAATQNKKAGHPFMDYKTFTKLRRQQKEYKIKVNAN